jgi:hypothetical protein
MKLVSSSKMEAKCCSETLVVFQRLHAVLSHRIELFKLFSLSYVGPWTESSNCRCNIKFSLLSFHFLQGSASVERVATLRFNGAQVVYRRSSRCIHCAVKDHGIMTFSFQTVALSEGRCVSIDDSETGTILLLYARMSIEYWVLELGGQPPVAQSIQTTTGSIVSPCFH